MEFAGEVAWLPNATGSTWRLGERDSRLITVKQKQKASKRSIVPRRKAKQDTNGPSKRLPSDGHC